MKSVDFKFDIDDRVKTVFGDVGIIDNLGFDDAGVRYWVKRSSESQWFKEAELTAHDKEEE